MRTTIPLFILALGVMVLAAANPTAAAPGPAANEPSRTAANPSPAPAGSPTGLKPVTSPSAAVCGRPGNEIAPGLVDVVNVDSLYWKNSTSTADLYASAKDASPSPIARTAMSFQNEQTTVCMDPDGDYVYEAYGANLRRLSTVDGSATDYALPHNGNGACGSDGRYIYVPRSGSSSSIDKYKLTGTYVNTTIINISPHNYGFAVARDTVWATNNTTGIVTYYGYACSRFTGDSISEDTLWRIGDVGASTPMNIAWDGQCYYLVSGGHSSNAFFRFHADRTLYTSGTFAGNARSVMCRIPRLTGWVQVADLPLGGRYKPVNVGGALCAGSEPGNDTGFVYAFKGNGTCEFYRYNIIANTWIARETIPAVNRLGKNKAVKKGASLVFGTNGKIYATKGNGTLDLWEYDPATRVWTQKADVPAGTKKTCKEGVGTVAVCEAGTNCIYLLKGSGTYDFYRYDADADVWDASLVPAPAGPAYKPYKSGSCLVYDGGDTIYALKGRINEFYAYALSGARWDFTARDPLPLIGASGSKKKVNDGSGMAYFKGAAYALKGGNTNEFWRFNCRDHKWSEQPQLTAGAKRVNAGGALCYSAANRTLYAFRGNNTREFWQYWLSLDACGDRPAAPRRANGAQTQAASAKVEFGLRVAPMPLTAATTVSYSLARPGNVSLRLYDATGRAVATLIKGYHPAGEYTSQLTVGGSQLTAGVYLLKYEAGDYRTTEKLVIE